MSDLPQANMVREQRVVHSPDKSPVRKESGGHGYFPDDAQIVSLSRGDKRVRVARSSPWAGLCDSRTSRPLAWPRASLSGLQVFPPNNPWNETISGRPVDPLSQCILLRIGLDKPLHPDFGTVYEGSPIGIPYVVVPGTQPRVPVKFDYGDESDPGPYPIPPDAPIEGGAKSRGDRHVLVIDRDHGKLYELFASRRLESGQRLGGGFGGRF